MPDRIDKAAQAEQRRRLLSALETLPEGEAEEIRNAPDPAIVTSDAPRVATLESPDSLGFDRKRWKEFIETLEAQIRESGGSTSSSEFIEKFRDPSFVLSSAASLEKFATDPRNSKHVEALTSLITKARELSGAYTSAPQEQQRRWAEEAAAFTDDPTKLPSADNPLASLAAIARAPETLTTLDAIQRAALPNVTIPQGVIPPGLSQRTWSGIMWGAAGVSTLATAWGFSDTAKGGLLQFPDAYSSIDQAMRSIGNLPMLGTPTVLTLTAGIGLALSALVSLGIKRGRDQLARTGFEHKTGTLGAMRHNPAAALLFATMVGLSGAGAIKGVVTNFAKAQQTQEFSGTALKEISPVVDKASATYENAKAFNQDFDRYLFLMVKEEGEPLAPGELAERNTLASKGWKFPPVRKQEVGQRAATKAWSIDGREVTPLEKYQAEAARLREAVKRSIPADQLPLRNYATKLIREVDLVAISDRVKTQLDSLRSGLETSSANKYVSALLMFFGLLNADPQTAQDTLTYAKRDLDKIPEEAKKLRDKIGSISSSYGNILRIIQGGGGEKLEVVFPSLPAADPRTLSEIEAAFLKIKSMLPERPASLWIPESDWGSAMKFLGLEDSPNGRRVILAIGIVLYGFIDLILAFLYLKSSRRKKEHLDEKVPEKFEDLTKTETAVAAALLQKLEALRPTMQSALGISPIRVDAEHLKAMLRKQAQRDVSALQEFAQWEKDFPAGSQEYLNHINAKRNDLLPVYGAWLHKFALENENSLTAPADLVKEAYPEYARATEFIAKAMDPNVSTSELTEVFTALRRSAIREGSDRDAERIEQSLKMLVAEEAARRSFASEVESSSTNTNELVRQLYAGLVYPLKEDNTHQIVTLLGQNAALLKLQYSAEQQRFRRHSIQRTLITAHPGIVKSFKDWLAPDGSITVPEAPVKEFLAKAQNPESPEYALLERTKARIVGDVLGSDDERADFDQDRALAQLNYIRTSFAPSVEKATARHATLKDFTTEVAYGIDPSSGRPTVLISMYDPALNDARVAIAAYPGRVPDMRESNPEKVDAMLKSWYELVVENELIMKLHARELSRAREQTSLQYDFGEQIDLKAIDPSAFPVDALVQYTIDTQRLRLLEERTSADLLYSPITDKEMDILRFGDMIAIRGYRRFEPRVIRTIFTEIKDALANESGIRAEYHLEKRTIHLRNAAGNEVSIPLIYYQNARALIQDLAKKQGA